MTASERNQPTQCERILEVLRDGRAHRMEEIHQRAGFMRLNSRVSELRSRGYVIECDKTGGQYVYTLISAPEREGGGVVMDSVPPSLSGAAFIEADGCLPTETSAPVFQLAAF